MASNTDYYALIKPAVTDKREIGPINTNMDTIDAALHTLDTGKKAKQSAKTDPTASGTAAAFIDSITQNANGEITATKKSVRDASTSQSGLMSAADKTKLNGIANNANNYSLPLAASGTRGGVQTGYSQNGKNYPVQLSSEKAYVNVPWTDTTYNDATTSVHGLMSTADKTKLNGIDTNANKSDHKILTYTVSFNNITPHENRTGSWTVSPLPDFYHALCVSGIQVSNSGVLANAYIGTGTDVLQYRIINTGESDVNVSVTFYILAMNF